MQAIDGRIEADIYDTLTALAAVSSRSSILGTAPSSVGRANAELRERLAGYRKSIDLRKAEFDQVMKR